MIDFKNAEPNDLIFIALSAVPMYYNLRGKHIPNMALFAMGALSIIQVIDVIRRLPKKDANGQEIAKTETPGAIGVAAGRYVGGSVAELLKY